MKNTNKNSKTQKILKEAKRLAIESFLRKVIQSQVEGTTERKVIILELKTMAKVGEKPVRIEAKNGKIILDLTNPLPPSVSFNRKEALEVEAINSLNHPDGIYTGTTRSNYKFYLENLIYVKAIIRQDDDTFNGIECYLPKTDGE